MNPNACIERIARALAGLDLDTVEVEGRALTVWLANDGAPPDNFERIVGFTETEALCTRIAQAIVAREGGPGARAPMVHDIANPEDHDRDGRLTCVRVDDRGDLMVYVWGCSTVDDALGLAEEYAQKREWAFDEEDLAAFQVQPDDRRIVLARSVLGNRIAAALQRAAWE
jgi:hypothetical protein